MGGFVIMAPPLPGRLWRCWGFGLSPFSLVSGHAYVEEQILNAIRAAPPALHFLSTIAAVLSPFFLFLMALALRLKFRMSI